LFSFAESGNDYMPGHATAHGALNAIFMVRRR